MFARWTSTVVVVVGLSLCARASAAPPAEDPDLVSGVAIAEEQGFGAKLLWVPRVIFFVPRIVLDSAFQPVRGVSYVWERLKIPQRFKQIFFNDAGTFGIFPVLFADSGFGLNGGVRMIHRDLFGRKESLTLRASFGGRYEQLYAGDFGTGRRLGALSIGLRGGYERGLQYGFYGIGNGDEVVGERSSQPPIDALADNSAQRAESRARRVREDNTAVRARFRKDLSFVQLRLSVALGRYINAKLSSELRVQRFEPLDADDEISRVYRSDSLVGLDGTQDVYTQLHLSFDNRRPANRYASEALCGPGLYVGAWLGYARGFAGDPSNHFRYALDLQWFIDLWGGDRLLVLRVLLDGVTASLDEIPFTDLPELGGPRLLRGYDFDRFRDRVHTLGSLEYQYNLSTMTTAYAFVDTGRVWRSLRDFEFKGYRMGFGGGVILHSLSSFLARIQIASSIDGGLFVNFSLDPVYATRAAREG